MEMSQAKPMKGRVGAMGLPGLRNGHQGSHLMRDRIGARTYRAGEMIFSERSSRNRLYIVREGWIRLYKTLPDGRAITFALLGPNSVVSQEDGGSIAEAFVDCVVTEADLSAVVELVGRAPQLASAIIVGLQRRISQLHHLIEQLLVRDTSMRLAGALVMLDDAFGEPMPDSKYSRISTTITHQFLANMIGSNRVTVTRKLLELQNEGSVISLGRNSLAVDASALRAYIATRESVHEAAEAEMEPVHV